eukprot:gene8565-17673_t
MPGMHETSDEIADTTRQSKFYLVFVNCFISLWNISRKPDHINYGYSLSNTISNEMKPQIHKEIENLIITHDNDTKASKKFIMDTVNGLIPIKKSILSTIRGIFFGNNTNKENKEKKSKGFFSALFGYGLPKLKVYITGDEESPPTPKTMFISRLLGSNTTNDSSTRSIEFLRQYLSEQKNWIFKLQDDIKSMIMKLEVVDLKINETDEIIETLKNEINEKNEIIEGITSDYSITINKTKTLLIQLIETHKQKIMTNRINDEKFHNFNQYILSSTSTATPSSFGQNDNDTVEVHHHTNNKIGDMSSECFKLDSYMSSIHILINDICTASTQSDKNFQDEIIKLHNQAVENEKISQSNIESLRKNLEESIGKIEKELEATKGDLQDANTMLQKAMNNDYTSLQDKINQLEESLSAAMDNESCLKKVLVRNRRLIREAVKKGTKAKRLVLSNDSILFSGNYQRDRKEGIINSLNIYLTSICTMINDLAVVPSDSNSSNEDSSLQDKIYQLEESLSAAMDKDSSLQDKINQLEVSLSAAMDKESSLKEVLVRNRRLIREAVRKGTEAKRLALPNDSILFSGNYQTGDDNNIEAKLQGNGVIDIGEILNEYLSSVLGLIEELFTSSTSSLSNYSEEINRLEAKLGEESTAYMEKEKDLKYTIDNLRQKVDDVGSALKVTHEKLTSSVDNEKSLQITIDNLRQDVENNEKALQETRKGFQADQEANQKLIEEMTGKNKSLQTIINKMKVKSTMQETYIQDANQRLKVFENNDAALQATIAKLREEAVDADYVRQRTIDELRGALKKSEKDVNDEKRKLGNDLFRSTQNYVALENEYNNLFHESKGIITTIAKAIETIPLPAVVDVIPSRNGGNVSADGSGDGTGMDKLESCQMKLNSISTSMKTFLRNVDEQDMMRNKSDIGIHVTSMHDLLGTTIDTINRLQRDIQDKDKDLRETRNKLKKALDNNRNRNRNNNLFTSINTADTLNTTTTTTNDDVADVNNIDFEYEIENRNKRKGSRSATTTGSESYAPAKKLDRGIMFSLASSLVDGFTGHRDTILSLIDRLSWVPSDLILSNEDSSLQDKINQLEESLSAAIDKEWSLKDVLVRNRRLIWEAVRKGMEDKRLILPNDTILFSGNHQTYDDNIETKLEGNAMITRAITFEGGAIIGHMRTKYRVQDSAGSFVVVEHSLLAPCLTTVIRFSVGYPYNGRLWGISRGDFDLVWGLFGWYLYSNYKLRE